MIRRPPQRLQVRRRREQVVLEPREQAREVHGREGVG